MVKTVELMGFVLLIEVNDNIVLVDVIFVFGVVVLFFDALLVFDFLVVLVS